LFLSNFLWNWLFLPLSLPLPGAISTTQGATT
jgi:hypothetical protein